MKETVILGGAVTAFALSAAAAVLGAAKLIDKGAGVTKEVVEKTRADIQNEIDGLDYLIACAEDGVNSGQRGVREQLAELLSKRERLMRLLAGITPKTA